MLVEVLLKVAAMEAEETEQDYRPRPSAAGPEHCLRAQVYGARGFPREPLMERMASVFHDGHVHEDTTATWIHKSAFILHDQQLRVVAGTVTHQGQPYEVAGSIDGLISDFLRTLTWLWEHKALASYIFERYWSGAALPLNYFTQCALYLYGLAAAGWPQVRQALLVIKNKNTSDYLEFRLDYDRDADVLRLLEVIRASTGERRFEVERPGTVFPDLRRRALARFEGIERHRAVGTLPERPFPEPVKFPCQYCQYQQRCWDGWRPVPLAGRIELTPADAAMVLEFEALAAELRPKNKRREALSEQIAQLLKAKGAKEGLLGDKLVRLEQRSPLRVVPDLLPDDIRAAATRPVPQEFPKVLPAPHTLVTRTRRRSSHGSKEGSET